MKLLRFVKIMAFLTAVSLIYIHMQMRIYDLAYQGKAKEKVIRQLKDEYGQITYDILKLKSSQNLGGKLLTEESELRFLDSSKIIEVKSTQLSKSNPRKSSVEEVVHKQVNFLAGLLSFRSQAEASR